MLVVLALIFSVFTCVTSDDSNPSDCEFGWIVGGKTLELYEVDVPTQMSVVVDYDEESLKTMKVGLRMIEVFNRYVMGTEIVNENFVKFESDFEESPLLTATDLTLLYGSATKIGTPIPFQIINKVKTEPRDRSRRFTQKMQDHFEETLSRSPVEEVTPVLVKTPAVTEETRSSLDDLETSPIFDRNLQAWDNSESNTLKVLRESNTPFRRKFYSLTSLETPEGDRSKVEELRRSWLGDMANDHSIGGYTPSPIGTPAPDDSNRPLQLFEMEDTVRQQNLRYNQELETAYSEDTVVGGANAIPCEEEEDSSQLIPRQDQRTVQQRMKSHRKCKKSAGFSYDETNRRRNRNRQAESRQQEQQKQREVRAVDDEEDTTLEPITKSHEEILAHIKKKTKFNMFGKTFRQILTMVGECNDLVAYLDTLKTFQTTTGTFPTHDNCPIFYKLFFISEDVDKLTQEKSFGLQYFSELIAKFEPNTTPDSQDIFLKGLSFYLLSELHNTLSEFIHDLHRRLTFFVNLIVQIRNRDIGNDIVNILANSKCGGGIKPEDARISSIKLNSHSIEGNYEISPVNKVKTYRRLQSVPYPVPGTDEYVYIYFEKDEYYDPSAPLIGSTSSCEQVSKSYYCRSSTIVPKPHDCMVALWYNSWDNIKANCNIGYRSQVNTPLTVSTHLGLLMADRSNIRAIKLHQAPGSSTKDYIVDNPVILKYGGTVTTNYGKHYQNFTANSGGSLRICKSTITESRIKEMREVAKNMDINDHLRSVRTFFDKYGWYLGIGSLSAGVLSFLNCLICCSTVLFKCRSKNPKGGTCVSFLYKPRKSSIEDNTSRGIEMVAPEEQERFLESNVDAQMKDLESSKNYREKKVRMNLEP